MDHPDYVCLKEAEGAVHGIALKINSVKESKQEEGLQDTLKKLEVLLITDVRKKQGFFGYFCSDYSEIYRGIFEFCYRSKKW